VRREVEEENKRKDEEVLVYIVERTFRRVR
jgi:hypothetical protein